MAVAGSGCGSLMEGRGSQRTRTRCIAGAWDMSSSPPVKPSSLWNAHLKHASRKTPAENRKKKPTHQIQIMTFLKSIGFSQSVHKTPHCYNQTLDLVLVYGIEIEHLIVFPTESSFIRPLFNNFWIPITGLHILWFVFHMSLWWCCSYV